MCSSATCGDGLIRGATEQCDDGNTQNHDGCSSICVLQTCDQSCLCDGWMPPFVDGLCAAACGDGQIRGLQTCDDSNTLSHDGCSSACQIETCDQNCSCDGWTGVFVDGFCETVCGDGLLRGTQECQPTIIATDPLE